LYAAHAQPGFEGIVGEEAVTRVPTTREIGRRTVGDRAGVTILETRHPAGLATIRTAEDVFAIVGYRAEISNDSNVLARVLGVSRDAPFVESALADRAAITPRARAGRRIYYRVIARMAGDHDFRRLDFQRAVERGIAERVDHTWRLAEDESEECTEFWATMLPGEFILEVRLSDRSQRHRDYKVAHRPGSLRPSVAAALAWMSQPSDDDVVLDPFCGGGTVLIERAMIGRYAMLYGSDRDTGALAAARANVGPRHKPIELNSWDAAKIPLAAHSVSKIITNLPWGERFGSHRDNRRLYPRWFAEMARILKPAGLAVVLTSESGLIANIAGRMGLTVERAIRVQVLGAFATAYAIRFK
jgi:predicted RNA methylase